MRQLVSSVCITNLKSALLSSKGRRNHLPRRMNFFDNRHLQIKDKNTGCIIHFIFLKAVVLYFWGDNPHHWLSIWHISWYFSIRETNNNMDRVLFWTLVTFLINCAEPWRAVILVHEAIHLPSSHGQHLQEKTNIKHNKRAHRDYNFIFALQRYLAQ